MQELIVLVGAIIVGGTGIVIWLNWRDEWAERDALERFQEAMRAGGMDTPLPEDRED